MSTRYRNLEWERDDDRYGREDDDRGRYERGPYERGSYGAREFGAGRAFDDYGYLGGAYGGGSYGRGPAGRDYGRDYGRGYGRGDYGRDYGAREYGPRRGREGDFIERGYERSHRRADERDERGGYQTDYGRTSERFFGPRGKDYDPDDYNQGYGPVGYDRRSRRHDDDDDTDDRRERHHGREGRNWVERAADEVRSWFGNDDDDERRRASAGRHRGRGPRNYRRSDERIRDDINDRLTDHDWLDASDIEVSVVAGEATLTGVVESRYAKRLAEDIAESVSGVTNVQNNLRVNRGWEVGYGAPAVNTAAVGDASTTGITGSADLTGTSDTTTTVRPSTRAAGRGQS
jgi:osmotically-inducible protein OsmY